MPKYFAPPSSLTHSELKLDKYCLKWHTCIILKSIFLHFSPLRLPKLVHFFQTLARCDHFGYYAYMKVTFQIGMCEKNLLCWKFYTILNIHTCIHFTLHTMEIWNTFEISFAFTTKFT